MTSTCTSKNEMVKVSSEELFFHFILLLILMSLSTPVYSRLLSNFVTRYSNKYFLFVLDFKVPHSYCVSNSISALSIVLIVFIWSFCFSGTSENLDCHKGVCYIFPFIRMISKNHTLNCYPNLKRLRNLSSTRVNFHINFVTVFVFISPPVCSYWLSFKWIIRMFNSSWIYIYT